MASIIDVTRAGSAVIRRPEAGSAVGAVFVFAFFGLFGMSAGFWSTDGYVSWLAVAAELGIIALPIGMLMIAGEFDLSIGSVLAVSSMTTAISVTQWGLPLIVGAALSLAIGALVGVVNGFLVVRTGLPSFIVTLVMLFSVSGGSLALSRAVTGTTSVSMVSSGFAHDLFAGHVGPFNVSLLWWLVAVAGAQLVLQGTRLGNWIFVIGGDADTAVLNGVAIGKVKLGLYVYSGLSAAFVGIIQAVEFGNADVTRGQNFVFQAIVASVVGGCLLSGGYGSMIGVMFGAITYSIVSVGIFYTGWNPDLVQLFVGILLFIAVIGNNFVRRLAMAKTAGGQR